MILIRFFEQNPHWALLFFAAVLVLASILTASRGPFWLPLTEAAIPNKAEEG
jgi:hypothetical protein